MNSLNKLGLGRTCQKVLQSKIENSLGRFNLLNKNKHCLLTHKTPIGWQPKNGFHTTPQRNIPPILAAMLGQGARLSAALTGRFVRKWYKGLNPDQKKNFWNTIKKHWYVPAGGAVGVCGYGTWYYLSHIEETPITGRKRFQALTHDQIIKIADAEEAQLQQQYGSKMYKDSADESWRVFDVMVRLLKANPEMNSGLPFDDWKIYVVDDPVTNACVLPNGAVFVFKGMLNMASSQDELAIVLGHEAAHAVLFHGIEQLSMAGLLDVVRIFVLAAIWCIMPGDGVAIVTHWFFNKVIQLMQTMPHSRKIETEADKVGLMFSAKACFDVRAGSVLWKKMALSEKLEKDGEAVPEFMSTHPNSDKRSEHLDFLLPKALEVRTAAKCPCLPSTDPRIIMVEMSKQVENHITARRAGQNLTQVTKVT